MDGSEWRKIVNSAELMTSENNSANRCRVLIAEQCDLYFIYIHQRETNELLYFPQGRAALEKFCNLKMCA